MCEAFDLGNISMFGEQTHGLRQEEKKHARRLKQVVKNL